MRYLNIFNRKTLMITSVMMLLVMSSCTKEDKSDLETPNKSECQVKGRWISTSYPNTLYEYTDSLRYTIYQTDGVFGSIEDAIPSHKEWWMNGDSLVTDLNFGNIVTGKVIFKCACNVMEVQQSGFEPVRFHKEGFDPKTCP